MGSHRVRHDWSDLAAAAAATISGFPGGASSRESACKCRRCGFDPWIGKIPWSRKWQPTPVFLHGKFHGKRSLGGYIQWGHTVGQAWAHAQQQLFHRDFHECSFVPLCMKFLLRIYFRDQLSHHLLNIPPGPLSSQTSLPAKCLSEWRRLLALGWITVLLSAFETVGSMLVHNLGSLSVKLQTVPCTRTAKRDRRQGLLLLLLLSRFSCVRLCATP